MIASTWYGGKYLYSSVPRRPGQEDCEFVVSWVTETLSKNKTINSKPINTELNPHN